MSANNFVLIDKHERGYKVGDFDDDTLVCHYCIDEFFPTLEDAVKAANEYMRTNEVEYGLRIEV